MLRVRNLSVSYGKIVALRDVNVSVGEGEIVALLGANGSGKSTLLAAISGLQRPSSGMIEFDGVNLTHLLPDQIVRAGVVQCPEGRGIFRRLTVAENMALGVYGDHRKADVSKLQDEVYSLFPIHAERRNQRAGTLSGGEAQMLTFARALMMQPKFLMLDEPSAGLAPTLVRRVFEMIRLLNLRGVPILLVEQNSKQALEISHRAYVLEVGAIVAEGESIHLRDDSRLRRAYLG